MNHGLRPYLIVIMAPLIWGTNMVLGRYLADKVPPFTLTTARFTVAVPFLIALVLPFGVSVYAIILGYELKRRPWPRNRKYVVAALLFVVVPIIVITADLLVRVVARSETLHDFVVTRNLHLDGKLE